MGASETNIDRDQNANFAVLIAGPTASGKSELALKMAKDLNGVIINTDSMQVYSVLDVLSARPQSNELAQVEHYLYGFLSPTERCSTGVWLRAVAKLLARDELKSKNKIFVGGTGLYFKALTDGFIEIPDISSQLIEETEALVAPLSRQQRIDLLSKRDPEMAKTLLEPDQQRLVRALSVLAGTGRSLANWQKDEQQGLLGSYDLKKIVLNPDREILNERIKKRFLTMLEKGGVEEVKEISSLDIDQSMPAMKAIGVREISGWLAGDFSREEAIEKAIIASRQYAKRQRTWFRRQMENWEWRH
ncbi:MAG: tRNA (adenosine(37)-N6)-dimethylallyltransferase MiaA [Devosiaceae bacterium]|nr:tRNA (adenosine(37)-N6)-dimethylallyltransferase MiaA [Devosiaceae bacterium]